MDHPPLCTNGCGFFGTPATQNLCSKCYREFLKEEEEAEKAKIKFMEKGMGSTVVSTSSSSNDVATSMAQLSLSFENNDKIINGDSSTKKKVERCEKCKKKVGILGFECRCGSKFCAKHRLPEQHECSFDYKAMGREILMKQFPVIKPDKFQGRT